MFLLVRRTLYIEYYTQKYIFFCRNIRYSYIFITFVRKLSDYETSVTPFAARILCLLR